MLIAITRAAGPALSACELTHIERQPIHIDTAMQQHRAYELALEGLGVQVISLPAEPTHPDAVFVEDTAVVVDELAMVAVLGAESRRAEIDTLAPTLARFRPLHYLRPPGTLEGGDVMRSGRTVWVAPSRRTNREGIEQLGAHLEPLGYEIRKVEIHNCLHLKTGCSYLGRQCMLVNTAWINANAFEDFEVLEVPASEPLAGNTLEVGGIVLLPADCPKTQALLEKRNFRVQTVPISEFQKAEAGLTCLSLLFEASPERREF